MWMILDYRCVIEVSGPDRRSFLQGLITQDVSHLSSGCPLYSLFLTSTGRFFCDFFMMEKEESIFLAPATACAESFVKKLSFYKLRSDVHIRPKVDWVVAVNLKKDPTLPIHGIMFEDPRLPELGQIFLGPYESLSSVTTDRTSYEIHRLILGIPEGPLDLEFEKSIPLENWMDEMNAISWTKGCFLGQELTSRTKHVGEVRKKLLSFLAKGGKTHVGDLLRTPTEEEIGKVISTYQNGGQGFALVRVDKISEDRICGHSNKNVEIIFNKSILDCR